MTRHFAKTVLVAAGLWSSPVLAANSVVVESKAVTMGAVNVPIHVRVTNDVAIAAAEFPLEIKSVTGGAFISSLRLQFADRLGGVVWSTRVVQGFATPDGTACRSGPGGYKTILWSGPNTDHPVAGSPEGVRMVGAKTLPADQNLAPGTDFTGSILMTVSVLNAQGIFDIDTTCVDPSTHLDYVDAVTFGLIAPKFTRGSIVVGHPVVVNLSDSGAGSLRDAIQIANAHPGLDSITFAIAGVISLASPLPAITDSSGGTKILGFTAPGAVSPFTPTVIIDGSSATPGAGLLVQSVSNWIEGLTFRNFRGAGVGGTGSVSSNRITGCRFYGNTGPGIDLGNDGITLNDPGDGDMGFNNLANYPVINTITEIGTDSFAVAGTTSAYARVELYLAAEAGNPAYQPETTTHGPAYLFLGAATASPIGNFSIPLIELPEWSRVTATAADSSGNTSEFSTNKLLTPDPLKITAYSEPVPPPLGALALPLDPPAVQIIVHSPPNSLGLIDSIGPTFNTFGPRGSYQTTFDYNAGGKVDTRVTILQPDPGVYTIGYILIGATGNYLTGIGIDGHSEVKQSVTFASTGQQLVATFSLSPPSRGDLNGDGVIDVFDVIASIEVIFSGGAPPDPPELVDVNCDGLSDVFDVIYLIDYSFSGGPAPCQ